VPQILLARFAVAGILHWQARQRVLRISHAGRNWRMAARMSLIYRIWWFALPIKLLLAAIIPLASDEAYYWVWSHHLQLSYFDHPPFVAWLFWLGQPLDGLLSAPRFPGVLLGHATLLVWIALLKPHLSERQLLWWLLIMLVSPLMGLGSLIITPDLPVIFWWSLSLLLFLKGLQTPRTSILLMLGMALGMGFCSKYHLVLFFPCAFLSLWFTSQMRALTPRVLLLVAAGFVLTSAPVWIWNMQNDFISFVFQLNHGLGAEAWKPKWTFEYLGGQLLLLFPIIIWYALERKPKSDFAVQLRCFGWFPLLFFALTSFKGRVEANWTMVAYPSVLALAVLYRPDFRGLRVTFNSFAVASAAVVVAVAAFPFLPAAGPTVKLRELYQYRELADRTRELDNVFANSYQMAAQVSFLNQKQTYKMSGVGRVDFYDFVPPSVPTGDRYHLVVQADREVEESATLPGFELADRSIIASGFDVLEYRRTQDESSGGSPIRTASFRGSSPE
jgi:4-amino-4-deoxy-L-arabinose transferase-like glycosyltransferase